MYGYCMKFLWLLRDLLRYNVSQAPVVKAAVITQLQKVTTHRRKIYSNFFVFWFVEAYFFQYFLFYECFFLKL